jgi:hypothetical protein
MNDAKPPRIVHLPGGIRAVDDLSPKIKLYHSPSKILGEYPRPNYAKLYGTLNGLGLFPVGVEFVRPEAMQGLSPPDWECSSPRGGFLVRQERRAWSDIRHAARADARPEVVNAAAHCLTYLDLLSLRLWQLSTAYNQMLVSAYRPGDDERLLVSTGYMRHIDAAVHAFVADAGSFRDLLAEMSWRFILGGQERVTTLGSFIKKAKSNADPLAVEIIAAASHNCWLRQLSSLRDEIVHVAPMGRQQNFHSCKVRSKALSPTVTVQLLHYPILQANGTIWSDDGDVDFEDEEAVKAAIGQYNDFVEDSQDGLIYCWQTLDRLVDLLSRIRGRSGFRGEMLKITDDDIINFKPR